MYSIRVTRRSEHDKTNELPLEDGWFCYTTILSFIRPCFTIYYKERGNLRISSNSEAFTSDGVSSADSSIQPHTRVLPVTIFCLVMCAQFTTSRSDTRIYFFKVIYNFIKNSFLKEIREEFIWHWNIHFIVLAIPFLKHVL